MAQQGDHPSQGEHAQEVLQQESDDSPMVYCTPVDYASSAKRERDELRNQGEEAVLMSEISSLIPRRDGESDGDYAKRYSDGMNDMIRRSVLILNDKTTHECQPNFFYIDGHGFDVGPNSGITKKEYREFDEWTVEDVSYADIPERFLKYESSRDPMGESSGT